jgi:cell division protein FtsB
MRSLSTKIAIYEENLRRAGVDDKGARYIEAQVTIAQQQEEIAGLRRRIRSIQDAKRGIEEIARGRRPRVIASATGRPVTASGALPKKAWEQTKGWTGHTPEFGRGVHPADPPVPPAAGAGRPASSSATAALVAELRRRLDRLQAELAAKDAEIATLKQELAAANGGRAGKTALIAPTEATERALRDKEAQIILLRVRLCRFVLGCILVCLFCTPQDTIATW